MPELIWLAGPGTIEPRLPGRMEATGCCRLLVFTVTLLVHIVSLFVSFV